MRERQERASADVQGFPKKRRSIFLVWKKTWASHSDDYEWCSYSKICICKTKRFLGVTLYERHICTYLTEYACYRLTSGWLMAYHVTLMQYNREFLHRTFAWNCNMFILRLCINVYITFVYKIVIYVCINVLHINMHHKYACSEWFIYR